MTSASAEELRLIYSVKKSRLLRVNEIHAPSKGYIKFFAIMFAFQHFTRVISSYKISQFKKAKSVHKKHFKIEIQMERFRLSMLKLEL